MKCTTSKPAALEANNLRGMRTEPATTSVKSDKLSLLLPLFAVLLAASLAPL